jgi:hypothetical protein
VLAPGVDPFFQAVMVFTPEWVDANFGTTGWAYCIRDDRLVKHIVDNKPSRRLSAEEVAVIGQAFASLARMEPAFNAKAEPVRDSKTADAGTQAVDEVTQA